MDKNEILLKQNKATYHSKDLRLLWNIENEHTLRMTLKRYVDRGILKRIHRGFYSTREIEKLDKIDLGFGYLNTYSYLSLESVLAREGIIFQDIKYINYVSSRTRNFQIGDNFYKARQLKNIFLNNNEGIIKVGNHFEATIERAISDILYYNPSYHFDNIKNVDLNKVRKLQLEIGYVES